MVPVKVEYADRSVGLIFAFSYSIAYTCARTLDMEYHYNALQIGLVLLSYGVGEYMRHKLSSSREV